MFELAIGLALVLEEAAVVVEEEKILGSAVELTMPRGQWEREARGLCKKHGLDCVATSYYATIYYDREVVPVLREELSVWNNRNRVWLISEGKCGDAPSLWWRLYLSCKVAGCRDDLATRLENSKVKR